MGHLPSIDLEDGTFHEVVPWAEHFELLRVVLLRGLVLFVIHGFRSHDRTSVRILASLYSKKRWIRSKVISLRLYLDDAVWRDKGAVIWEYHAE